MSYFHNQMRLTVHIETKPFRLHIKGINILKLFGHRCLGAEYDDIVISKNTHLLRKVKYHSLYG